MDSAWQLHADKINVVVVHDDIMGRENEATREYDRWLFTKDIGFPALFPERINFTSDPIEVFDYIKKLERTFAFASMSITARVSDTVGGIARATVNVTPSIDMHGDYRLSLTLTEDSVHGSGFDWEQHNYYSGTSGAMSYGPYNFNTLPSQVPAESMYYDFVARSTVPATLTSTNGISGSLPSLMAAGTSYTYTSASIPMAPTWIWRRMRVIATLIDNNAESPNYGHVLNSTRCSLILDTTLTAAEVTNVNAHSPDMTIFPNPACGEANIEFSLREVSDVSLNVYDAIGHVAFSYTPGLMQEGTHKLTIPADRMPQGVYNAVITTTNGKTTRRFSVIR